MFFLVFFCYNAVQHVQFILRQFSAATSKCRKQYISLTWCIRHGWKNSSIEHQLYMAFKTFWQWLKGIKFWRQYDTRTNAISQASLVIYFNIYRDIPSTQRSYLSYFSYRHTKNTIILVPVRYYISHPTFIRPHFFLPFLFFLPRGHFLLLILILCILLLLLLLLLIPMLLLLVLRLEKLALVSEKSRILWENCVSQDAWLWKVGKGLNSRRTKLV